MNISGILNSAYLNTGNYNRQSQKVDTVSSATKTQNAQNSDTISTQSKTQIIQNPDAISSATKSNGGDHYFEARA